MTDEEVINELVRHKQEVQNDFGWNITLQDALDMALEALKTEPCEDCVSRQAVLACEQHIWTDCGVVSVEDIKALPPVTPKQKTGHWVLKQIVDDCSGVITWYECSECGRRIDSPFTEEFILKDYPYCHCGAKMDLRKE